MVIIAYFLALTTNKGAAETIDYNNITINTLLIKAIGNKLPFSLFAKHLITDDKSYSIAVYYLLNVPICRVINVNPEPLQD